MKLKQNFGGKILLTIGPMFSGKTSRLLQKYKRYLIQNKKCLLIKYEGDNRYNENKIVTHDYVMNDALKYSKLSEVDVIAYMYDVICIDEIRFFSDAPFYCDKWANSGIIVEVCGLNGTYNRTPFSVISNLIPLVEKIKYLSAICKNNSKKAFFSKLINNNIPPEKSNNNILIGESNNNILIGGSDLYKAVDRLNYFIDN